VVVLQQDIPLYKVSLSVSLYLFISFCLHLSFWITVDGFVLTMHSIS
jgi:hypothetical protein